MSVLLIGEAPAPRGNRRAFDGPSGDRLAQVMGMGRDELLGRVRARNLLRRWPGASGKGSAFPVADARAAARRARLDADVVLLAGLRVAGAFGARAGFFEWFELRGRRAAVIPHPSGVNRWWNDAANRERARAFLRGVLA